MQSSGAAQKGITGGMSDTLFAPNAACTRAQIVTFLWRAAGSPEPKALSSFADVPADAYYAKAVAWAVENGITEARAIQRLHPAPSAREHKAQRSCTVRQAVRRLAAAAAFTDVPADAYYADAAAWAEQKASPAASETVCSVRITTAREHRSLRSCTECTAANKQINRWKAAAGEYPCRRLFIDFLPPFHALERAAFPDKPLQ